MEGGASLDWSIGGPAAEADARALAPVCDHLEKARPLDALHPGRPAPARFVMIAPQTMVQVLDDTWKALHV